MSDWLLANWGWVAIILLFILRGIDMQKHGDDDYDQYPN